jgi:hypothetical protein
VSKNDTNVVGGGKVYQPSNELINLFANEVFDCGHVSQEPCADCKTQSRKALSYAAELAMNDMLPDNEEEGTQITSATISKARDKAEELVERVARGEGVG